MRRAALDPPRQVPAPRVRREGEAVREGLQPGKLAHAQRAALLVVVNRIRLRVQRPGPDLRVQPPIGVVVPPAKPEVYKNMENLIHHFKYVSHGFKVPRGEAYSSIESPKGELGVYIVSDGSEKPYRLKLRVPSFMNLQTMDRMCRGGYFADVVAALSSLDPVFGECYK